MDTQSDPVLSGVYSMRSPPAKGPNGTGEASQWRVSRLLPQVRDAIPLKRMSLNEATAYVGWVRRFILLHGMRHHEGRRGCGHGISDALCDTTTPGGGKQRQALAALKLPYVQVRRQSSYLGWVLCCWCGSHFRRC